MSSSSSIAAARRRRAGGPPPGPQPPGSTSNRPPQNNSSNTQPPPASAPMNPFMLLQQHHIKINILEQTLKEMASKQDSINDTRNTRPMESVESSSNNSQFNINELSDLIISKVEGQLDLKALYDNDERLMNEIEELKTIVQSQQMVLNGLNTALYSLITKLDVSVPSSVTISNDNENENDNENDTDNEKLMTSFNDTVNDYENTDLGANSL
jgi:hypothetical protein